MEQKELYTMHNFNFGVVGQIKVKPQASNSFINQVVINGEAIDMIDSALSFNNVDECDDQSPCSRRPCRNGGMCQELGGTDYVCQCPADYTGKENNHSSLSVRALLKFHKKIFNPFIERYTFYTTWNFKSF